MNATTKLIALSALAFGLAGSAFAQEVTVFPAVKADASVTRADVRAQAIEALHAGELSEVAILTRQDEPATQLSREAVRQATIKALRRGGVAKLNAEAQILG